ALARAHADLAHGAIACLSAPWAALARLADVAPGALGVRAASRRALEAGAAGFTRRAFLVRAASLLAERRVAYRAACAVLVAATRGGADRPCPRAQKRRLRAD